MIKRLGIRFDDNDFYYTILAFLEIMSNTESARHPWENNKHHWEDGDLTKERVVFLFNSLAPGLYWARQNRFFHSTDRLHKLDDYLQIEVENVYFDEEIDEEVPNHIDGIWGSGEFHWIDLDTNEIFPS